MAEPVAVHAYIEDRRVVVNMGGASRKREENGAVFWEGGRELELETTGLGDEEHVIAAIREAYRRFRD